MKNSNQSIYVSDLDGTLLNDYAVLLMGLGRNEEARRLLEKALEVRPDDALAAANLEQLAQP